MVKTTSARQWTGLSEKFISPACDQEPVHMHVAHWFNDLLLVYLMKHLASQWHGLIWNYYLGHSVSHWPLTMEAQVWSQTSLCGIYGQRSMNWTTFSPHTSVFPTVSIYHFSILNHLGLTLYNLTKGGTILTYHRRSEESNIILRYLLHTKHSSTFGMHA